jgi:hypothetical protein
VDWSIVEGVGGSLSQASTPTQNGFATITLTTTTHAGDQFVVEAKIKNTSITKRTATITVVPGDARDVAFSKTRNSMPADEISEVVVTATIRDAFGNLVEQGTDALWDDEGLGELLEPAEVETNANGQVSATLRAGPLEEEQILNLYVDDYEASTSVNNLPLIVTLTATPVVLDVTQSQTSQLTATVRDINGVNVPDGTQVHWYTSNGTIVGSGTTVGGVASATLSAFGARVGKAVVIVSCDGYGTSLGVEFISTAPLYLKAGRNVVDIFGPPGARIRIGIAAAFLPSAFYPFDEIVSGTVADIIGNNNGTVAGATLDPNHSADGVASLLFNGSATVSIPAAAGVQAPNNLRVSAYIRPTGGALGKVIEKNTEYSLAIEPSGKVSFTVNTPSGTFKATSNAVITGDEWEFVSGTFSNNVVTVALGGDVVSTPSVGLIIPSGNAVVVGSGFVGNIDDVGISKLGLILISGVDPNNELVLGANGRGSITVTPGEPIPDYEKVNFELIATATNEGHVARVKMAFPGAQVDATVTDASTNYLALASDIAIGLLVDKEAVEEIAKEIGTWAGGGTLNWKNLAKNSLWLAAGLIPGQRIGAVGIRFAKSWRRFSNANLKGPFTDATEYLWKKAAKGARIDDGVGPYENFIRYAAGKSNSELTKLMEMKISKSSFKSFGDLYNKMGPQLFDSVLAAANHADIGPLAAKKLVRTLSKGVADNVLLLINDAAALNGLAKVLKKGIAGSQMRLVLKNSVLYTGSYDRIKLLTQLGDLVHVPAKGFSYLVSGMKKANNLGRRYELQTSHHVQKNVGGVQELGRPMKWAKKKDTDIDIVGSDGVHYQSKSGPGGFHSPQSDEQAWADAARVASGRPPGDYSKVKYVVPPPKEQNVPPKLLEWFRDKDIDVFELPL